MAHDTKSIVKDVNNKPVPQYYNPDNDRYEVIESSDGILRTMLIDETGNVINMESYLTQILNRLDDILQAVSN